ncbi:MAG: hypothetical protein ACOCXH_01330 [Cyclobacteriaceae bacterium]
MFKKDYLLRLIEEAVRLLAKAVNLIDDNDIKNAEKQISKTYAVLKANPDWADLPVSKLIITMENAEFDDHRMEIVADLFKVEARLKESGNKMDEAHELLIKSLAIYEYIDKTSTTYSFERVAKIDELKHRLN